jgi:hypothetical protein
LVETARISSAARKRQDNCNVIAGKKAGSGLTDLQVVIPTQVGNHAATSEGGVFRTSGIDWRP